LRSRLPAHYELDPTVPPTGPNGETEGDALLHALGSGAAVALPLLTREATLGVVTLVRSAPGRHFGAADLALAEDFVRLAALAVANALRHESLRQEIRAREEFLAAFSHDLKNPIACIRAYAQLLRRQVVHVRRLPLEQMAQRLERVESITTRLAHTIDDVLDDVLGEAKGEQGGFLELNRRPVDLVALVRQIVAEYGPAYEQTQFVFETEVSQLTGVWDQARLERVVGNLLSNSVKYGGEEVTIAVTTEERDSGTWARLSVSDRGMGIPAADLPYVFDRLRRAGNVRGRIGGSGIGLAAAKRIVEQHGGTIGVESQEGRGSVFTVWLPLDPPGAVVGATEDAPTRG
jgi:signal transduction histidine kinase